MQTSRANTQAPPPSVSVILTVYKRTDYLKGALESALAQTHQDFEILVADDSGTAASREIVANYRHDPRVRYLPNTTTLGIVRSLVNAVGEARGELIAIINDDDLWECDLLSELIAPLLADSSCVAAFSDHSVMDDAGRIDLPLSDTWSRQTGRLSLPMGPVKEASAFVVVKHGLPIANCTLFRKACIDWSLVSVEVAGAYDYWISCLLIATGRPIFYVPMRLARYRVHPDMETRRRSHDKREHLVYMFTTMRKMGWFPELDTAIRSKLADALLVVGRDKQHFGMVGEARRYFLRSFLLSFSSVPLVAAAGSFLTPPTRKRVRASVDSSSRHFQSSTRSSKD